MMLRSPCLYTDAALVKRRGCQKRCEWWQWRRRRIPPTWFYLYSRLRPRRPESSPIRISRRWPEAGTQAPGVDLRSLPDELRLPGMRKVDKVEKGGIVSIAD
jgi:hypothetical protein